MKDALIKAIAEVTKELRSEDSFDSVINIAYFESQFQKFAPRFMGSAYQDAQKFLRYLLEGFQEDLE